jgi:hypothetical protein
VILLFSQMLKLCQSFINNKIEALFDIFSKCSHLSSLQEPVNDESRCTVRRFEQCCSGYMKTAK